MSAENFESGVADNDDSGEALLRDKCGLLIRVVENKYFEAQSLHAQSQDKAMGKKVYVARAPLDTPGGHAPAILLTEDGKLPMEEDELKVEQVFLYLVEDLPHTAWVRHIRDGTNNLYLITPDGYWLLPEDGPEGEEADLVPEPEPNDDVPDATLPDVSQYGVLRQLQQKIVRWQITPLFEPVDDEQIILNLEP